MLKEPKILCSAPLVFAIWMSAHVCTAQVVDDFSDGDFTNNPGWSGDTSKFVVESNQLRLMAPAVSDVAYLSVPSMAINNASWEFFVHLDFDPSGSNYADVYLSSDNASLTGSLAGYFVRIGNTTDEVSLYRQTGITKTKIIDGLDGRVSSMFANKPDLTGPKLISAVPISATEIVLTFNEKLDDQLPVSGDFTITPARSIVLVSFSDLTLRSITLELNASLQSGITYSITTQNIQDCNGNLIQPDFIQPFLDYRRKRLRRIS